MMKMAINKKVTTMTTAEISEEVAKEDKYLLGLGIHNLKA